MSEFRECASCAAKTGSPSLCSSCLINREIAFERDAALARVAVVESQRNSAFDTANTARALLSRVEELEKLLGDCGEAEETFEAFLLTAHALYPSSHPDYYREQGKLAGKRLAVWNEQRRIARARTRP